MQRNFFLFLTVLLSLLLGWLNPLAIDEMMAKVLAIALLMISWWLLELLPLAVVALLPLILFPLCGVSKIEETSRAYSNPVIFLFMGGFFLGLAIEKWGLHRRIALGILTLSGTSGNRIILGFIIATGFLSMWLSNTATTMMMFPISLSVIGVIESQDLEQKQKSHFALSMMLAIAYASNFGGISTIIGTPPNAAFAAFMQTEHGVEISFVKWMLLCVPISIFILVSLYLVLVKWLYPNHIKPNPEAAAYIKSEKIKMGAPRPEEKRVLAIFIGTALLWITKDFIKPYISTALDDNIIALIGSMALFLIPSGEQGRSLLEWEDTKKMPWGIILLFGGGIALASALEKCGILKMTGEFLAHYSTLGLMGMILIVIVVSIFMSELLSNVAQVIVFAPVLASLALAMDTSPLYLGIPMTLAASCASMLPMGTPPNAIAFSSGYIPMRQMIKTGFVLNLICIAIICIACIFLMPLIFSMD